MRISHLVCPHAEALVGAGVRGVNRKWEASLEGCDHAQLPASNQQVRRSVHTAEEALSASHGQTVNGAVDEPMPDAEVRRTIVERRIQVIHMARESSSVGTDPSRSGFVIQSF